MHSTLALYGIIEQRLQSIVGKAYASLQNQGLIITLQANSLQDCASAKALKWASDTEEFNPPFDVIIASDLLYDAKAVPELMLTIVSLSSSNTITYLAFELRPTIIRAAFQAMEIYGLKAEQVGASLNCLLFKAVSHCAHKSASQIPICCFLYYHKHILIMVFFAHLWVGICIFLLLLIGNVCRFCNQSCIQTGKAMTSGSSSSSCLRCQFEPVLATVIAILHLPVHPCATTHLGLAVGVPMRIHGMHADCANLCMLCMRLAVHFVV